MATAHTQGQIRSPRQKWSGPLVASRRRIRQAVSPSGRAASVAEKDIGSETSGEEEYEAANR